MPRHAETRVLPYTPEQLFDLVVDVRAYPDFLPWVVALRVKREAEEETVADMMVGFKALRETFTSRFVKRRPIELAIANVEGPLRHLRSDWRFRPVPGGCAVEFTIDFALKNRVVDKLVDKMFEPALRRIIRAFEERADALYGAGASGSSSSSAHSAA